ncbi:armadillo-type protein [Russula vinacea]|nr:armadillo-type protein [Russula vinacea]
MPKELRKRGRRHKTTRREVPDEGEGPSTAGPSWIVPRTDSKQQLNPEAPFGYVDPELKAYFRTVDDQLKEWQQNRDHAEGEDDIDPNENRRLFLMAALQEISGKERELATDPDCAGGLERMAYSMDDFVRRVFMDALTGSYELLIKHRFASHVIQTLLEVAPDTIARESRGIMPKLEEPTDKGELRTLTQLILDFSEEILPSLPGLIMDQFASHVVRALFLLLCPQLFQSDVPHKSQTSVRSKKSVSWKARQGPLKSIFGGWQPPEFQEVAKRFVMMLRTSLDANEVRSLAGNKVACPVLQMALEIEADQGLSVDQGSLMDHVLVGLISASHNDPSSTPEASDYIATLLRDPTSSHLLETLVARCPESALERSNAEQLSYALHELRDSLGKLRQTRIGILRALIERAAALNVLEDEVCESICSAFQVGSDEDRKSFVHCALSLKTLPNPLEPTTTGALLLQSLLRLHAPHNGLVLNSIESLPSQELLALTRHPAASRVLDAIIDGPTIPPRSRRALLRAMETQFADVIDDRIGARVGARCWAAADPYFKEKLARALLPHATRLAGSPHARFFTRGLALSLLQRKPEEWRRQHATPSSGGSANTATSSSNKDKNTRVDATTPSTIVVVPTNNKDPEADEARASSPERNAGARNVVRSALEPAPASTPVKSGTKKPTWR